MITIIGTIRQYRITYDTNEEYSYISVLLPEVSLDEEIEWDDCLCYFCLTRGYGGWFIHNISAEKLTDLSKLQELSEKEKQKLYRIVAEYKLKESL